MSKWLIMITTKDEVDGQYGKKLAFLRITYPQPLVRRLSIVEMKLEDNF